MAATKLYWIHTLSPTHVGTGRGLGYIDLPLHRDKVTNWPIIPASAFKGVWRDWAQQNDKAELMDLAFGKPSDRDEEEANSGSLIPTDARLVCLPIRSFRGTFAWCTSAMALQMLHRDLTLLGVSSLPPLVSPPSEGRVLHAKGTVLQEGKRVYFEDLDFEAEECSQATEWAEKIAKWVFPGDPDWAQRFKERFAVLPDAVFDFLTETGTEVDTRVRIEDDTKTVKEGALWSEESLPAETILAGFVVCDRLYTKNANSITPQSLLDTFTSGPLTLQIGGKATVGRGRVRCVFASLS